MRYAWRVAAFLVVAAVVGFFVPVTHTRHTCVICRKLRVRTDYLVVPLTRYFDSDCSRWYAANVEPTHVHVWERSVCIYATNLYGLPLGVGCSPGRNPIWGLTPDLQLSVYQHFRDPLEAKALFANLTDAKTHDDRIDEHDTDRGHLVVEAIWAWGAADFPGTWEGWWKAWYAKHVAEHEEWLRWLNSDSGLNFYEWKAGKAPL